MFTKWTLILMLYIADRFIKDSTCTNGCKDHGQQQRHMAERPPQTERGRQASSEGYIQELADKAPYSGAI